MLASMLYTHYVHTPLFVRLASITY